MSRRNETADGGVLSKKERGEGQVTRSQGEEQKKGTVIGTREGGTRHGLYLVQVEGGRGGRVYSKIAYKKKGEREKPRPKRPQTRARLRYKSEEERGKERAVSCLFFPDGKE